MTMTYKIVKKTEMRPVEIKTRVTVHELQPAEISFPGLDQPENLLMYGITGKLAAAEIDNVIRIIGHVFSWHQTSEGQDYWADLIERLARLGKILEKHKD